MSCKDCKRTIEMLDANDIELLGEGKYARCMNCEDERKYNMDNSCKECGDRVGRHALFVGILGFNICYSCDVNSCDA